MIAPGLIEETDERPDLALDDERRLYYRLTENRRKLERAFIVPFRTCDAARCEPALYIARGASGRYTFWGQRDDERYMVEVSARQEVQ